jgi:hypothetical protein
VNRWIGGLFSPWNLDSTVVALVGAQDGPDPAEVAEIAFRRRIAAAQSEMNGYNERWNPAGIRSN